MEYFGITQLSADGDEEANVDFSLQQLGDVIDTVRQAGAVLEMRRHRAQRHKLGWQKHGRALIKN